MCLGIASRCASTASTRPPRSSALLSDGDCQEGQTWEAATAAAHFGVPNLTAIVDYNHLQTDGTTEEVMDIGDVRAKFEAFGWDAVEIDGHDMDAGRRGARAQPHRAEARGDRLPRRRRARASRRWRAGSASTASRRRPSRPRRRWRSSRPTLEEQTKALAGGPGRGASSRCRRTEAKTEPTATRHGYGDALAELGERARGRRRARRRSRRLHPVDQVRQAVPGALLQRRGGRGEHDVDGLRPGRDGQGAVLLDLRDLRRRAAPTTRSGSASPTTS